MCSKPSASRPFLAARSSVRPQRRAAVQPQAAMEVAQLANEAGFIFGVSGVMCAMTLIVSGGAGGGRVSAAAAVTANSEASCM